MNLKTFTLKETLLYRVPAGLVDMAIHIGVFRFILDIFKFYDPLDMVLARPRSVYFLIVGYLIATITVPAKFYGRKSNTREVVKNTFTQTLITLSLFALSVFLLFNSFAGRFFLQEGILATFTLSLWHLLFRKVIHIARKYGRNKLNSVFVGADENALRLYDTMTGWDEFNQYRVLGFFAPEGKPVPEDSVRLGDYEELESYLKGNKIHVLFCSLNPATDSECVNGIIRLCENLFIDFYYVPNMDGYLHRSMSFTEIGHVTIVKLREEPLANPLNAAAKRTLDVILSGLFLITLFPIVWCAVAIGTRISSPGPVFFRQTRTGYKGKPFTMYKFRSMKVNADADRIQATADDPRKTKFGDFLRRTSIDELPQFINVFKGDMSIIGPRPHMELHTEMYNKLVDEYMVRSAVKPGLTGWAQVNGCRGETKELYQMKDRVRHDIWYIENWSLGLDVRIFFMTIHQIFKGDSQAY